MKNTLYLDMDDVVADWAKEARHFFKNVTYDENGRIPNDVWEQLRNHHRFYRKLELMPGATELVQWAREFTTKNGYDLRFLTAIPPDNDMPYAFSDKVIWANERFPDIPVFFGPFSHDKHKHCRRPGDILIDDRTSNCMEWRQAGGIAHQYTSWPRCREWIAHMLPKLLLI